MRWPWTRVRHYEAAVDVAREALEKARLDRAEALKLAAQARRLREQNGFAEAIRAAMGVKRDDS